jgi:hypothetical protein
MADSVPLDDCLVCLQPTSERSTTLFLYNCNCIYAIHADCFRDWRRRSETSRICLICHEGLDTFESDEEERPLIVRRAAPVHVPDPPPPQHNNNYLQEWERAQQNKNMCLFGIFVFVTLLICRLLVGLQPEPTEPPPLRPLGGQNRLLL